MRHLCDLWHRTLVILEVGGHFVLLGVLHVVALVVVAFEVEMFETSSQKELEV